jgi:hypothetical protein
MPTYPGWTVDPAADTITFDFAPEAAVDIEVNEYATADIGATDVWALGAWSPVYGYPAEVEFFADRLVFACTRAQPQTLWLSRTGDYSFYGKSTPIVDDDAISATLNARGLNAINNLVPLQSLVVFTSGSEWRASGGDGDIITPSTLGFRPQTHIGVASLQALVVGSTALFAQAKGYSVYELAYDFAQDGFTGGDLLAFSAHLLERHTIRDWAWQAVPYSVAWAARDDGLLLSMTYKREQQVVGWMRHPTQGTVEQVCTVPEVSSNALYQVVRRVVDGQVKRYVERMADPVEDVRDYVGLDCSLTYDGRHSGGTTIDLAVIGGGGWGVDDLLTATASGSTFAAGDVGDVLVFGYDDTVPLRLVIVQYVSVTVVKVRPSIPVVAGYQGAQSVWAFARDTISGLGHLEGMAVYALVDGYEQGPFTVDSGDITLDPPGAVVHVGLAYDCDLETLDVNVIGGESVSAKKKLIREVALQVRRARSIHVGVSFDRLTEIPVRTAESLGQLPPLVTETIKVNVSGEWGSAGRVCVRHRGILPLEILSITPDVQFGG